MGPVADPVTDWDSGIRPAAAAAESSSCPSRWAAVVGRNWAGRDTGLVRRGLGSADRSTRCGPAGWRYRRHRIDHLADRAE